MWKIYHFQNTTVTIAVGDREILNIFVPERIAVTYVCNRVPIDSTDILRIISKIGRLLHFSSDINISLMPTLPRYQAQTSVEYLRLANSSNHFSNDKY